MFHFSTLRNEKRSRKARARIKDREVMRDEVHKVKWRMENVKVAELGLSYVVTVRLMGSFWLALYC